MAGSKKKKESDAQILKRREQKRESMRRARLKIKQNPLLLEESKKKERQRYHERKKNGKIKVVEQMSEREKRQARKTWRKKKSNYRKEKKIQEQNEQQMIEDTPPKSSPLQDYQGSQENLSSGSIRGKKMHSKTIKVDIQSTIKQLLEAYFDNIGQFLNHVSNIIRQYEELTKIKNNLKKDEILMHVDFSENYMCKYNREIQSAHFGGSKPQVTIHTSVVYCNSEIKANPISYGTISECNRHDAPAVIAHLISLKEAIRVYVPDLSKIHFLSDGPSTQYKNKTMFQLIGRYLAPQLNVDQINWHYSESSHGKGAPDGVGAVLKRTADNLVAQGLDIPNCEKLVSVLQEHCKVNVKQVLETSINEVDKHVPTNIAPFEGTMKVHEIIYKKNTSKLQVRSRTCTACEDQCKHYYLGSINLIDCILFTSAFLIN